MECQNLFSLDNKSKYFKMPSTENFTQHAYVLPLKCQSQLQQMTIFYYFFFIFSEKTSLDFSCELFAWQMIHMKCQDLFSRKNKKKRI